MSLGMGPSQSLSLSLPDTCGSRCRTPSYSSGSMNAARLPAMRIIDQTSETVGQPQLYTFFKRVAMVMVLLHSNRTLRQTQSRLSLNIYRVHSV